MPHNSSSWVQHTVAGGWATDLGSTYYGAPQNGVLSVPWCRTCENIKFNVDGSWGKYPGLHTTTVAPIKAPQSASGYITGSQVRFLHNYTRMGTTLTGTTKFMAVVQSYLYSVSSTESVLIGDLNSAATDLHHMSTFNDLLIIGGDPPRSWDQTTFQNLAGTPPDFGFSIPHRGRQWAAGVPDNPSRLYYSILGSPEDWVGSGSGSIDIDPGDGDGIVGLLSWKNELWVFKGPHRLSIHRITGSVSADFARVPFVYGISAAGQESIFPVGDDFGFWSPRGSCHSLSSTDQYGDYAQTYLNYPLLSWFRDNNNVEKSILTPTWQTVTDTQQNISYCVLNNHPASSGNRAFNLAFMMDWRFRTSENPYPRFIRFNMGKPFSAVALGYSAFDASTLVPKFGTNHGFIYEEPPTEDDSQYMIVSNSVSNTYYTARIETPALTYGPSVYTKSITGLSADIVTNYAPTNDEYGELDLTYSGRGVPAQTVTFTATTGSRLGSFILGTDQLGGAHDVSNFYSEANGDSRAFVYTLVEDGTISNVVVRSFGALLTPTGESLEN